ncbi:uncharacterized protein LTR77_009155 [Saxophila tyrrhenica]|uniref:Stress response RCI peptide n=1 Tax=Saxophila tyrrhenica TaxID=1690608 RepID=A0AAV9NZ05_9PEZI|nr:hypothetical protein LTR77_009155 [Saxophila tyrrhenica]
MCGSDIFLGLIALLFPPLPVWVKRGICSADSLINLALCCLGVLPGLLHAWYIIATTPEPTYTQLPQDAEQGHVTYYYVQAQPQYRRPSSAQQGKPQGYGTVSNAPNAQFPAGQQGQQGFVQPQQQQAGPSDGEVPPTYQQAVGDHKVQHP